LIKRNIDSNTYHYFVILLKLKKRDPANLLVDIVVINGQIRALRPVYSSDNPMPISEPKKSEWLKTYANTDRIQKRILGNLGKVSLSKAQRLVNYQKNTENNNNGIKECGSILAYEEDFVRLI
jgi:hypothetical protein